MDGNAVGCLVVFGLYILHSCCYQLPVIIKDAKTWKEAQSYCRENHHDLITIKSLEQATKLGDMLMNSDEEFWIGLYGNFYEFRWSMDQKWLDEGGKPKYINWQSTQPNANNENIMCANMVVDGEWADFTCSAALPFICYDDSSESKYILVNDEKSWIDAQIYCRKHHTDLVSIRNESENAQIVSKIKISTWIGFYRLSWLWSDGQSRNIHSFKNWGEPNFVKDHCATTTRHKWTERPCSRKYAFICSEMMEKVWMKLVMRKLDSSMNLEEMQDAILQKLDESLKEKKISEPVSLKWIKQSDGKIFQGTEKKDGNGKQVLDCFDNVSTSLP